VIFESGKIFSQMSQKSVIKLSPDDRTGVMLVKKMILILLVFGFVSPLRAAPLFEADTPIEIELTGPLWTLVETREEPKEWPFRLNTQSFELDLQVKARGNSRMRVCAFPPLRLNFKKGQLKGTPFEGQDKLKLVTHCKKGDRSKADVMEEYAAYKIFSLFSDISFRVRLVNIKYQDTDDRIHEEFRQSYGFLIEDQDHLAKRVDGSLSEIPAVALNRIDEKQAALLYVYQYLIGNTDWSFVAADSDDNCCHNIKLIKHGDKHFPTPYDFDLAGLVNASYARPDASLRIKNVRVRKYRGFCTDPDVLRGALTEITSKEGEVKAIINNLPQLSAKEKVKQIDYLDKFFRKASDEEKIISSFEKTCHP
jgi:hypothetical protein